MVTDSATKNAHIAVRRAIQDGLLENPNCCELCGAEGRVVAHHDDYAKPLDVRWLCKKCHMSLDTRAHRKFGRDKGVPSNNHHNDARNAEIVRLFDNGRGLTHRQIAEKFGMNVSAVSMVIVRWNKRFKKGESKSDASSQ